jgi:hypothetical protein
VGKANDLVKGPCPFHGIFGHSLSGSALPLLSPRIDISPDCPPPGPVPRCLGPGDAGDAILMNLRSDTIDPRWTIERAS